MNRIGVALFLILILVSISAPESRGSDLCDAVKAAAKLELRTEATYDIANFKLTHFDMELTFDSGRIAFFKPLTIDSVGYICGAHFEGQGTFRFTPQPPIEKEQLQKHFESEFLDQSFKSVTIFFSQEIYHQLDSAAKALSGKPFGKDEQKTVASLLKYMTKDESWYYPHLLVRAQVEPPEKPYLHIVVEPDKRSRLYYKYNPYATEEITFSGLFRVPGADYMELICKYSRHTQPPYRNLAGIQKPQIKVYHYQLNTDIKRSGEAFIEALVSFEVLKDSPRAIHMHLHSQLQVDSITNQDGRDVPFIRYEKYSHRSLSLYLYPNQPMSVGDSVTYKFKYHGKIAERDVGGFYVTAGARWYPSYTIHEAATFDMSFTTPKNKKIEFVATGELIEEEKKEDGLFTHWVVKAPTRNVSFSIGFMKKYEFKEKDLPPVDIYFDEQLNDEIGQALMSEAFTTGKNMHKQVADDVINSMKLYSHLFGPYPHQRLSVSEILAYHGEAFPGFIHMGISTWIKTDSYGHSRLFRAHEVAHQWWGIDVGFESYHDQWMSEGFSEYSALMYIQAAMGNDRFMKMLEQFRKDIFSVRKYLFQSGTESGPIALGYRTGGSQTSGDYDLIIYKKGAFVLHMLRQLMLDLRTMNEESFFAMIKSFYQTYKGKKPSTEDFRRHVEQYIGYDLTWFFDQWVYSNDLPTYKFSHKIEKQADGSYTAFCKVITEGVDSSFSMYVPFEIDAGKDKKFYGRVLIDSLEKSFDLPGLPFKPKKIRLNPFESVLVRIKD